MQKEETYRPVHIEFDVSEDETLMPESFGEFETSEEASKYIQGNLVAINQSITVSRHMDNVEKKLLREKYEDVLENVLPVNERKHVDAANELTESKRREKDAAETVNATITEVKHLSAEVKRGLKEMGLDESNTMKIPFKGRFYYYTYIDKAVRLVAIREIGSHEKEEIFSQAASNEKFIEDNFGDGKTES